MLRIILLRGLHNCHGIACLLHICLDNQQFHDKNCDFGNNVRDWLYQNSDQSAIVSSLSMPIMSAHDPAAEGRRKSEEETDQIQFS